MAYNKQNWANTSAGNTPLNATRLNYMETGIDEAHNIAEASSAAITGAVNDAAVALATANAAQTTADNALAAANASLGASVFTTKGILIAGTGPSSAGAVTPGTTGQLLEYDNALTTGMKWGRRISTGAIAPDTPQTGDIWIDPNGGGGGGTDIAQFSFYPTAVAFGTGPGAAQADGRADATTADSYVVDNKPTFVRVLNDPLKGDDTIRLIEKDAMGNWHWSAR